MVAVLKAFACFWEAVLNGGLFLVGEPFLLSLLHLVAQAAPVVGLLSQVNVLHAFVDEHGLAIDVPEHAPGQSTFKELQ